MMLVLAALGLGIVTADEGRESGALEVAYEPIVCVTTPCPQFRVFEINGDRVSQNTGADISEIDVKTLPMRKNFLVIGTWIREGHYLQVTPKEVILTLREKVKAQPPSGSTEPDAAPKKEY